MIRKLRVKLIAVSMLSLTLVLLIILGGVNFMSYRKILTDADAILSVLADNSGAFPQRQDWFDAQPGDFQGAPIPDPGKKHDLSPETPYESRYFSVLLDGDGAVSESDTGQIAAVDAQTAADYAQKVWSSGRSSGFQGDYRYIVGGEGKRTRIIFLDCGRTLSSFRTTLLASVGVALLGLGAVLILLIVLSKRIIKPVAESYEKQKRFITDAGHEIKTPLTIISADTDLAEMELGENEWLGDIKRQAERLTRLTCDLIYLSRMEEDHPRLRPIEFPFSDVVEEMARSFLAPAKTQGKELHTSIPPMLSCTGDEQAIRQLVSILLDNALKYSPPGGRISVSAEPQGRALRLTVTNTVAEGVEPDKLPQLFDRFYRMDQSRSTQTGGYGLGLSIARSIAAAHRGKIWAERPTPDSLSFTVLLPM